MFLRLMGGVFVHDGMASEFCNHDDYVMHSTGVVTSGIHNNIQECSNIARAVTKQAHKYPFLYVMEWTVAIIRIQEVSLLVVSRNDMHQNAILGAQRQSHMILQW